MEHQALHAKSRAKSARSPTGLHAPWLSVHRGLRASEICDSHLSQLVDFNYIIDEYCEVLTYTPKTGRVEAISLAIAVRLPNP